ncbi:hypothetical protein GGI42DRAFT_119007 [Trichoderma sp. SZMC 28013]
MLCLFFRVASHPLLPSTVLLFLTTTYLIEPCATDERYADHGPIIKQLKGETERFPTSIHADSLLRSHIQGCNQMLANTRALIGQSPRHLP